MKSDIPTFLQRSFDKSNFPSQSVSHVGHLNVSRAPPLVVFYFQSTSFFVFEEHAIWKHKNSPYLPKPTNLPTYLLTYCVPTYLLPTYYLTTTYLLSTYYLPTTYLPTTYLPPNYYLLTTYLLSTYYLPTT